MASSSNSSKKYFGHSHVVWRIQNFPLQTFSKEWFIQSPEFTINGSEETNWYMNLRDELVDGTNCILLNLIRCATDSGPEFTWLQLQIYYISSNGEHVYCEDKLLSLKKGSKYEVCLGESKSLLPKMEKSGNTFLVVCHMIVYRNGESRGYGECSRTELKRLSKNMLDLYRSGRHFDAKLFFGDNIILAHKAILCVRNEYICGIVLERDDPEEQLQGYKSISFTEKLDNTGMKKILSYLYSGDLRHVLEEPSFDVLDCASFLEINEIENYYESDKLELVSTIDIQEYNYTLQGYSFTNGLITWCSVVESSTKTYKLLFYPRRENNLDYITLFTKTLEKLSKAYIEFEFSDKSEDCDTVSFTTVTDTYFDIGEIIRENVTSIDDVLELIVTLKLTSDVKDSYIDDEISYYVSCLNEDFYYSRLSSDLYNLFRGEVLPDIVIHGRFQAHKCVLASRCQFFSDMLTRNERETIIIPNIKDNIVFLLLSYIYSGTIHYLDNDEDALDLYKVAVFLNLPELKSLCSESLKVSCKTNRELRCRAVLLAEECGDDSLMKSVRGKILFYKIFHRILS